MHLLRVPEDQTVLEYLQEELTGKGLRVPTWREEEDIFVMS
jgi:hypothetical protein